MRLDCFSCRTLEAAGFEDEKRLDVRTDPLGVYKAGCQLIVKMFGMGEKGVIGPRIDELAGVLLSEKVLSRILQPKFKSRIMHIGFDGGNFTLDFDSRESVNAAVLGEEDVVSALQEYYRRKVIDVSPSGEGHMQFLARFEE